MLRRWCKHSAEQCLGETKWLRMKTPAMLIATRVRINCIFSYSFQVTDGNPRTRTSCSGRASSTAARGWSGTSSAPRRFPERYLWPGVCVWSGGRYGPKNTSIGAICFWKILQLSLSTNFCNQRIHWQFIIKNNVIVCKYCQSWKKLHDEFLQNRLRYSRERALQSFS